MEELRIFQSDQFGVVRTVQIDGATWFVGKDVAEALGYSNARKALADHADQEDRGVTKCDTPGGVQELNIINESGLYSLVLSSKLSTAKQFKHWVTSSVLPQIRQTGAFQPNREQLLSMALLEAQKVLAESQAQIEEMRPKAFFADAVSTSSDCILIRELAKLLKQNGCDIGEKWLFERLRNEGYLIRRAGSDWNLPTQKSMELGLFQIKESLRTTPDGTKIDKTAKVTAKGQRYFVERYCRKEKKC